MVVAPALTAVKIPLPELIVAALVLLLDQVPPEGVHVKDESMTPGQMNVFPEIAAGDSLTEITLVAKHEPVLVYVMIAVPMVLPETTPVVVSTDATDGLLLVHVPLPPTTPVYVVKEPTQTVLLPVIGDGATTTFIVMVLKHPLLTVYVTTHVPSVTPVTTPVPASTVAFVVS